MKKVIYYGLLFLAMCFCSPQAQDRKPGPKATTDLNIDDERARRLEDAELRNVPTKTQTVTVVSTVTATVTATATVTHTQTY